ncbi:MAG: formate dehydrogenase accessory sulfurtransferase FdhD [Caldilineaceae bacterium]
MPATTICLTNDAAPVRSRNGHDSGAPVFALAEDGSVAGVQPVRYRVYERGGWRDVDAAVIEETTAHIYVNGRELAALMCSPVDLDALALGFARSEELIGGLDDVLLLNAAPGSTCVDLWLAHDVVLNRRPIRTSGCGGGVTFDDLCRARAPLPDGPPVPAQEVIARYLEFRANETLYPIARGVHGSALATTEQVLLICEDIGRHNTLDKLWGKAMLGGIDTAGCLLVTTGRISMEMLGKAAKMGVSVVASRSSPTSRALALAQAWNMTVIGYVRRDGLRVYSGADRVV